MALPTTAYWQVPPANFHKANLPTETDILIIGSGITGCSIAKHILESDSSIRVAVVEARDVCSGATGRNGGHIKSVPEHTYGDYITTLGLERTREIMHFTISNVDALLDILPTLSPELQKQSEIRTVESLNLFTDESVFEEFKSLVEAFGKDNPDLKDRGRIVSTHELQAVSLVYSHKHNDTEDTAGSRRAQCSRWILVFCRCRLAISSDYRHVRRTTQGECRAVHNS